LDNNIYVYPLCIQPHIHMPMVATHSAELRYPKFLVSMELANKILEIGQSILQIRNILYLAKCSFLA